MTSQYTGPTAQDKTSDVAHAAVDAGSDVIASAVEQVKDVAGEASRQARDLLGEAGGQLQEQAHSQQQRAAGGLRALSEELASMAGNSDRSGVATEMAQQASDRLRSVAGWLETKQPGDVLDEVRDFARRHPGTFVLGAVAAGVLAGRVARGAVAATPKSPGGSTLEPVTPPAVPRTDGQPVGPGRGWAPHDNRPSYDAALYTSAPVESAPYSPSPDLRA